MIDRVSASNVPLPPQRVLRMVKCERMAGSLPCWEYASSSSKAMDVSLSAAQPAAGDSAISGSFKDTLAAQNAAQTQQKASQNAQQESYGFKDILDIINPLQHIPIVDHIYRRLSGDTIKPSGEILGGALYGGAAGAAGGLFNAIFEHETGKDIMGNVTQIFAHGKMPEWRSVAKSVTPAQQDVAQATPLMSSKPPHAGGSNDLSGALLAFTDLKHSGMSAGEEYASNDYLKLND